MEFVPQQYLLKSLIIAAIISSLMACTSSTTPETPASNSGLARAVAIDSKVPLHTTAPVSPDSIFQLAVAQDINPDPKIVEINLEAKTSMVEFSPGVMSEVYTYNGTIPGPLIETKQDDLLIVNFTNNLPEPTTIHWHGLQLPADMDGSVVGQNPIQPGASFRYQFEVEDAALFWYHPHVRSNEQVEKGLAGPLLVAEKESHLGTIIPEHILVLDDILLDSNGQVKPPFTGSIEQILLEKINGREGNMLLVNGKPLPTMQAVVGTPLRLRMVNVANTRFMNVSIPEHLFSRIGGDGGLLKTPELLLDHVMIVPGERADIVFTPQGEPGEKLPVYWNDVERGMHTVTINNGEVMMGDDPLDGKRPPQPLFYIELQDNPLPPIDYIPPMVLNDDIKPIAVTASTSVTTLKFGHTMPMPNGDVFFTINGKQFSELTSDDAPDVKIGETQIWELVNMAGGDHPFHLHGFFFQVLDTYEFDQNGQMIKHILPPPLENKDMVNLPRRPGPKGSSTMVRIAINFDPGKRQPNEILANGGVPAIMNADIAAGVRGHSGGWQFHCHILEHADGGMMSFFEIWN